MAISTRYHKNIVDLGPGEVNVPAMEALAKLYDKLNDATQSIRLHDARSGADAGREAARRIVLQDRHRRSTRKLGDRSAAQDLGTRWRSTSILRTRADAARALRQIRDRQRCRLRQGSPVRLDQEQSCCAGRRGTPSLCLLVELGRIREEMLGDHWPAPCSPAEEPATRPTPRTRRRRSRSSTSTSRKRTG